MTTDLLQTKKLPAMTMRELVYGKPVPRRPRFPSWLIFVAAFLGMSVNCATSSRPVAVQVESVGELTASATHVTTAPLKHDAPPEFAGVVGSDSDDVGSTVTTVSRADASTDTAELPDVAPKDQGLKTGEVR